MQRYCKIVLMPWQCNLEWQCRARRIRPGCPHKKWHSPLTYLLYKHTYAYLLFEHMYMYLPYKHMHTYLLYNTIIQNFQMCTRKRLTIKQNHLAIPKALYLEHKMHVRKYCIIENINLPLMHVCCAFITCFPSVYSARHQYSPKFHRMPTCKCISLHTCTYLVPCLALASASRF